MIKDIKDLIPYMEILIGGIRNALCDPLADVRSFAASALGKIAEKLGIQNSEKYFIFLNEILESETSNSIERSGAANALAEVLFSLGLKYFESKLPFIFKKIA